MIFLVEKIPWFGSLSGYERLPEYLFTLDKNTHSVWPRKGIFPRLIGKATSILIKSEAANQNASAARFEAAIRLMTSSKSKLHILFGDEHLPYWSKFPEKLQRRTIYSFHQPPSQWTAEGLKNLQLVNIAVVLYQKDIEFFRKYCNSNCQIKFIHYGIDVDFFKPGVFNEDIHILYNGVHLRNVEMFERMVKLINHEYPNVIIDALVPPKRRKGLVFESLKKNPTIKWHAGLSDQQLRDLYQQAYVQLLPMNECGASTAMVEALACGLPIITTDMGGIRDYGGGEIYPIVENNDDESMFHLIERYLNDRIWRNQVAIECRNFAVKNLSWPVVSNSYQAFYTELL